MKNDTIKKTGSMATFVTAEDTEYLPLPSEQREIRERMSSTLHRLALAHLTPKEIAQIHPQSAEITWSDENGGTVHATVTCGPMNHKRKVTAVYNESPDASLPQAEINFVKRAEYPGDPFPSAYYILRKDGVGTETERIELTAPFSDNRSKIVLRRLSNNQIALEFEGKYRLRAEREMRKIYKNRIKLDPPGNDQMYLQELFANLRELIIFDDTSRHYEQ